MADLSHLMSPARLGDLALKNSAVMAPMTRSRAISNVPNDLMARHYAERAGAGLIITEGTAPSPSGLGYPRIPGVYSDAQIEGWRAVTDAVHEAGGLIALQIMHVGRIAHPLNMPDGGTMLAPSAVAAAGQMYTDEKGPQPHPEPSAMSEADIEGSIAEFEQAARNARAAGFDAVEIHGANGYLIDQFLNPKSNTRGDGWGGSPAARNRYAVEVVRRVATAIGAGRTGIRLSPFGAFNDVDPAFEGQDKQFLALAEALAPLGLAWLHLVDHEPMGAPPVPDALKRDMRRAMDAPLVLSGGYDGVTAEAALAAGEGDVVAFGRPFLANPDLLDRFARDLPLNEPNPDTFYTPGPEGYVDYARAA